MKTSSEVIAAINALEQRFPVSAWRSGDVDLWPAFRMRLYANGAHRFLEDEVSKGVGRRLRDLARRGARALLRVPFAALSDRENNARVQPDTTAVFLSDGVSFVRMEEKWFDRVMDPVMEALELRGRKSLKLTPLAEAHIPRHRPSLFVQPTIDRIKLQASRGGGELVLPGFPEFQSAAQTWFGEVVPSLAWLQVQARRLQALASWFGGVLERCGASYAFANTYYSLEGLAFVQAARRLGLRSVDLQHGIQGPHHVAYARWASLPPRGFSTLPDEFWVWSREEADVINEWSGGRVHLPRVTGNFWLQRWCDDTDPVVARYVSQTRALRSARGQGAQVLVCLTWGVPESENDKLVEAAARCGGDIAWWWRLHPVRASQAPQFARSLARHGLDGSRVAEVTNLPLYALLHAADLVLAHSSTVIKEAAALGVPSVVTSDYGAELHSDLVRQGVTLHATRVPDIVDAVTSRVARSRRAVAGAAADANSLQAAVDAMVIGAGPHILHTAAPA